MEEDRDGEKDAMRQDFESVGILAGGIAHDFNNLLTGILGNIYLAKSSLSPENEVFKRLASAEEASIAAKELTCRLLTYAQGGEPVKTVSQIEDLIRDSAETALKDSQVTCKYDLSADLWPVRIDRLQIGHVIHNIVTNAVESMPEGGTILISAENQRASISAREQVRGSDCVKISIRDRGKGISRENLRRIFDPYFTTKPRGSLKGMGLGLAICHSILKKHHGMITVDSVSGMGTTFHLYLPAGQEKRHGQKRLVLTGKERLSSYWVKRVKS